ncbi:NIN-like protein [Tanacetum coccineum]
MDLFEQSQSVDSVDRDKSSCSGSGAILLRDLSILDTWKKISLEKPVSFWGESKYLTHLWVSRNEEPLEEHYSCFDPGAETTVPHYMKIKEKIRAALKLLTFRVEHVLVQFWSARDVGRHKLLTTVDQPFGVGVNDDGLYSYRRESEQNLYLVDKDDEEQDISPPARVFRRGVPEWSSDLTNYRPEDFSQQDSAIRCNLHGYLALPVFDSVTSLCVGVLELLTSSIYMTYAFEVQQVYKALKRQNLTSPQVHDSATPKVPNESRQNELDKIFGILKTVCDIHNLPLAQTWAVSPSSSFVSHNKVIETSCDSFDIKCAGKVCMSTAALPFYVRDLSVWSFREACKNQHLDKYHGFVGRALVACGSGYCQDVTKLSEEEYPLVHSARMCGLITCFTVFMHSVEGDVDYVLEFFLQLDGKDSRHVLDLVQTLKQNVEVASGFVLGKISPTEFIGSPQSIQMSSITTANTLAFGMDSSDPESFLANAVRADTANVPTHSSLEENSPDKPCIRLTNSEILVRNDARRENINVAGSNENNNATSTIVIKQKTSDTITDAEEKSNGLKRGRKRKIDLITMEAVEKHVGKPIGQAAESVGVSRSTLKRFCRENGISSWPMPKQCKKASYVTDPKLSPESGSKQRLKRCSRPCIDMGHVVLMVIRVKRWSCSSKHHDFSGKWWRCGRHKYLPSMSDTIYQVTPEMTVKATFKDDMIKFRVPISSGLMELENEVAQRFGLKGKRLRLKYKDDAGDLLLLTCDDALQTLPELLASNTSIRLLVELACE